MTSTIGRGLLAGAFGTLLLNAATYLDMALTGRPASDVPGRMMLRTAGRVGLHPPEDPARTEAYGQLGGFATGLALGGGASVVRSWGVRTPGPVGAVLTGAAAMAATDSSIAAAGISDPRAWTSADWLRDAAPHLAYGAGVRWALGRMDRADRPAPAPVTAAAAPAQQARLAPTPPPRPGLVTRAFALGVAAGGRSSLGLGGPLAAGAGLGSRATLAAASLVGAELVVD